ncbi:MAG: DNA polymerase III subunit gamma/tau [Phascolarctobacterium sp.]|nr:MAG: DNA polymerase III subunit gamma/tau [Phascolarctobacterium sp.]
MAYVALYRKWRPQGFDALVGQEAVRTALTNALETGRIAHAYLFAGPRGTGKTSTAKILAKAVNCEHGPTPNPCNKCQNCVRINDGTSMDVFEIDAASNRGIDEIRDLREKVAFAPVSGRYKVYIIDEVHMLTTEAFNALLKTLEEPPPHVIFILATTEPHKIPATIHSRCQRFDFKRVTDADIVKRLREVADGSGIAADDDALQLIAVQADGGMRDALSLLDQCGVMAERVTAETVRSVLGIVGREALRELVKAVGEGQVPKALELLETLLAGGKDVKQIITELAEYLRAVLLYKASPDYREIYLTDTKEAIAALEGLYSTDRLMAAEERLHQCTVELRQSVRGRIAAEMCLFDLCRIEGSTLAALTARVQKLEAMLAGQVAMPVQPVAAQANAAPVYQKPAPQAAQPKFDYVVADEPGIQISAEAEQKSAERAAPKPAAKPGVPAKAPAPKKAEPAPVAFAATPAPQGDAAAAEDLWQQVLEILKAEKKRSMVACASGGHAVDYVNGILTVVFKNKFNCKRMNADDYKKAFESVLLRIARCEVRLNCVEEASFAPRPAIPAAAPKQEEELEPVVKKAMEAFGGTLQKL